MRRESAGRLTAGFHETKLENHDCFISDDGPINSGEAGMCGDSVGDSSWSPWAICGDRSRGAAIVSLSNHDDLVSCSRFDLRFESVVLPPPTLFRSLLAICTDCLAVAPCAIAFSRDVASPR